LAETNAGPPKCHLFFGHKPEK